MRRLAIVLAAVVMALVPVVVAAQNAEDDNGFLLRVNGSVVVPQGEHIDTVIVINSDVRVEGTAETVVVINGDAVILGAVEDEVVVVNGELELTDQSRVNDVILANSDLQRAPGAVVEGSIEENDDWWDNAGVGFVQLAFFWFVFSVFVIAAALLFAAVGGRQLSTSALLLTNQIGQTILAAVIVWIGLPIVAALIILTVVGIPISIAIFLFVLPILWFAGYLVVATRIGAAIARRTLQATGPEHPYIPALVGVAILQVVGVIPVLGWLVVWLAGLWGSGALALLGWRAWRDRAPAEPQPPPPLAPAPPPVGT